MPDAALWAVYKGFNTRLTSDGSEVWAQRARASVTKAKTLYPYVIYFYAGGGAWNATTGRDAQYSIGVKCVTPKMSVAMTGAERISVLLDNKGKQDDPNDFVFGSADWDILTITEEETIYLAETPPNTDEVYHIGAFYRVVLEHT